MSVPRVIGTTFGPTRGGESQSDFTPLLSLHNNPCFSLNPLRLFSLAITLEPESCFPPFVSTEVGSDRPFLSFPFSRNLKCLSKLIKSFFSSGPLYKITELFTVFSGNPNWQRCLLVRLCGSSLAGGERKGCGN